MDASKIEYRFLWSRRAKRYIVRIGRDRVVSAVIPRGGSREKAFEFLKKSMPWVLKTLAKRPTPPPRILGHGTEIWFQGELHHLQVLDAGIFLAGNALNCGRTPEELKAGIDGFLRTEAAKVLPRRTSELAAKFGISFRKVTLRTAKTRWGSCNRHGAISLNWRLIQTPAFVQDYVITHELVHILELNHSPRFWAEVERRCPDPASARRWLKDHPVC